jgi:hypothetical protein
MVEMTMNKETSHWWWFDSHYTSSGSPWLQSTLAGKPPPPLLFFLKNKIGDHIVILFGFSCTWYKKSVAIWVGPAMDSLRTAG